MWSVRAHVVLPAPGGGRRSGVQGPVVRGRTRPRRRLREFPYREPPYLSTTHCAHCPRSPTLVGDDKGYLVDDQTASHHQRCHSSASCHSSARGSGTYESSENPTRASMSTRPPPTSHHLMTTTLEPPPPEPLPSPPEPAPPPGCFEITRSFRKALRLDTPRQGVLFAGEIGETPV